MTTPRTASFLPTLVVLLFPCLSHGAESLAFTAFTSNNIDQGQVFSLVNQLRGELNKTGVYDIMERTQMDAILREQGFQQSGACSEASCAVEMGKLLAVKYMTLGHIGLVGRTYTVSVRIVDVATGRIVKEVTNNRRCSVDQLLTDVMPLTARELAGAPPAQKSRAGTWIAVGCGAVVVAAIPVIYFATRSDKPAASTTTDVRATW